VFEAENEMRKKGERAPLIVPEGWSVESSGVATARKE